MHPEVLAVIVGYILGFSTMLVTDNLKSRSAEKKLLKALKIELSQITSDLEISTYVPISLSIWDQIKVSGQFLKFGQELKNSLLRLKSILENRNNLLRYHLSGLSPPFAWQGVLQGGRLQGQNVFFTNPQLAVLGPDGESIPLTDVLADIRIECEGLCEKMKSQVDKELKKYFPYSTN